MWQVGDMIGLFDLHLLSGDVMMFILNGVI